MVKRILFNEFGYSLIEWELKADVEMGDHRHKHKVDQVILVTEGSMKHGNKVLEPGDGYFTPADTPYTFEVGPEECSFVDFRLGAPEDVTSEPIP
jgi:hypothetical protein